MTMYTEDVDSFFDSLEFDDSDERVRPGRRPAPLRTPGAGSSFQRRPNPGTVTEAQLQAAVRTLDGKINTLSGNVRTLETRTGNATAEMERTAAALRKEAADRKKEGETLRKDLQQTRELAAILPILSNPGGGMGAILPALLLGGLGGGGGDNNNMTMMLVAVAAAGGGFGAAPATPATK